MKIFRNRAVAWLVLVLAIAASCLWGLHKKPADVPEVRYYQWICDEAGLLDGETEKTVEQYNAAWDDRYRAVIAVASVDNIDGWTYEKFCARLGGDWGLGPNDMLLLLVRDGDYYVACGDNVLASLMDSQQAKLQSAIEPDYYGGDYDGAVTAFFRQADVVYAQMNSMNPMMSNDAGQPWPEKGDASGVNLGGVLLLIIAIFVVWMLLDRVRYNRYQRRSAYVTGAPRTVYYPVFWGRPRVAPPPVHRAPPPRQAPRQAPRQNVSRQSRPSAPRSGGGFGGSGFGGGNRSRGGGFGGGGFGGGKR